MIDMSLTLDYSLAPGWLAPWVQGVAEGKAIGRTCSACGRVSFTPLRRCPCGESDGTWTPLPGTATLIHRTEGADGFFGLVQFDGADTRTVVKLVDWDSAATQGHIIAPKNGTPALLLAPFTAQKT